MSFDQDLLIPSCEFVTSGQVLRFELHLIRRISF